MKTIAKATHQGVLKIGNLALFALDTGDAEQTEIAALRARNQNLQGIAARRNC